MRYLRVLRGQWTAATGAILLFGVVAAAAFAPLLSPANPKAFDAEPYLAPSLAHPFGTDNFGRDVLSRVLYGSRIALLVGVMSAGISALVGIILGALPGYYGGWLDDLFCRFVDITLMIPVFFLLILVTALFGNSIYFIMLAIGLTTWPSNARLMRSQVLTLKTRPYVLASKVAGAGTARLLMTHIIPNGVFPVIANTALQIGAAVLMEAGLSFLGLGDPNVISWGQMIREGQTHLSLAWWMSVFPGLSLLFLVAAFNFVGDGLNYAMNPRLRGRSE